MPERKSKALQARQANSRKARLPSKLCPVCSRPFTWRKKWEREWAQVVYCSKACAAKGRKHGAAP
jgi:hypothetical protein